MTARNIKNLGINFTQLAGQPTNEIAVNIIMNIRSKYAYLVKTLAFYIKCIKPEFHDEKNTRYLIYQSNHSIMNDLDFQKSY